MTHPYQSLDPRAYWKTGVAQGNILDASNLWTPKFSISREDKVVTAGSCFAQHISRAMVENGFNWIDSEPAPDFVSEEKRRKFGYGVFSFRTGNIYTARLLRQWIEAAFGQTLLDEEVWEKDGRFFDPLRPAIEPGGFESRAECFSMRAHSLVAIRRALEEATLFVFTLGLTESWRNQDTNLTYAACPGTLAGAFDANRHIFHNLSYPEIHSDLNAVFKIISRYNPSIRFLLTVSPVPLTATAANCHVLPATIYSKSVLRAVAGDLVGARLDTDYFPSFEIISSFPYRGMFYMPNQREVSSTGVRHVMAHFFAGLRQSGHTHDVFAAGNEPPEQGVETDVQCEEALLEAFAT